MSYTLIVRLNPVKGFNTKLFSVGQFTTGMDAYLYYTLIKNTSKTMVLSRVNSKDLPVFLHLKSGKEYTIEYHVVKSKPDYPDFDTLVKSILE